MSALRRSQLPVPEGGEGPIVWLVWHAGNGKAFAQGTGYIPTELPTQNSWGQNVHVLAVLYSTVILQLKVTVKRLVFLAAPERPAMQNAPLCFPHRTMQAENPRLYRLWIALCPCSCYTNRGIYHFNFNNNHENKRAAERECGNTHGVANSSIIIDTTNKAPRKEHQAECNHSTTVIKRCLKVLRN